MVHNTLKFIEMKFFLPFLIFVIYGSSIQATEDIRWAPLEETIPDDAFVAGYDPDGKDIYIGQVTVPTKGTFVGALTENSYKEGIQVVADNTILTIKESIKILCGSEPIFSFLRANSENLHLQMIDNTQITGGKVNDKGMILIGRLNFENGIKIGPISAYDLGNSKVHIIHEGKILTASTYEVLINGSPRKRHGKRRGGGWRGRH